MASVMQVPVAADRLLPTGREWLGLGGIVALHAVALAGLALGLQRPEPVTPPAIIGVLVSAPPPSIEPPKPLPLEPEPRPRPVLKPKPAPLPPPPVAPPSEQAIAAPPPEPAPETAPPPAAPPAPPAPPAPAEPPAPPAPLIQPRSDAAHLNNPLPSYPVVSRRLREQGRVLFDVHILPDGSVGEIRLKQSSGFERLDRAAMEAVRQWRYVPARRGDTPIAYWYVQPFTWSLDR